MGLRWVLFDADGVMQRVRDGWLEGIFSPEAVKRSVQAICNPPPR